jgi:hypothetical protein
MKNILPLALCLSMLAGCGKTKLAHPVAVTVHAEVKNTGVTQGIIEPGDTVDLSMPFLPVDGMVQVELPSGKRGRVAAVVLALPDSLKAKL